MPTDVQSDDLLAGFVPGVFVRESGGRVPARELWVTFLEWREAIGNRVDYRVTRRVFHAALEAAGLQKTRTAAGMTFVGLRRAGTVL